MGGCPVHTEAGRYVGLIEEGRFREAYHVARRPNPFASICGRVCAAPCETVCRRGKIDEPIAIRALKRFVCERFGVESMVDLERLREVFGKSVRKNGIRVAVVGAGPAGLSCAHDLALLGYDVTVFESQPVAGGCCGSASRIPAPEGAHPAGDQRDTQPGRRAPGECRGRARLHAGELEEPGICRRLRRPSARTRAATCRIEGVELDGVLRAVDFLLNMNLGYRVELGRKVIVIGGGNVAIDVARSAARQERPDVGPVTGVAEALDVARSAIRFGAKEVHLVCLEDIHEMPASREEIHDAQEEHIQMHTRRGPHRILGSGGKVVGLETVACTSVFDGAGRFNPQFAPGSGRGDGCRYYHHGDRAVVGPFVGPSGRRYRADSARHDQVDPKTLATTAPGIYAGGDVSFGPRNAIDAVANGKKAAQSIHASLGGGAEARVELAFHEREIEIVVANTKAYHRPWGYEQQCRVPVPALPIDRRVGVSQIELGYGEDEARREASRCLHCWENTEFNPSGEETGSECILCGMCSDICPESCIELVASGRVDSDGPLAGEVSATYGIAIAGSSEAGTGTVMIKDEDRCIRCGLCAMRCPVACITMEAYTASEPMAIE
jgi:formate dehydrogenase beta subunit